MILKVGLTGGIASGKSTVASFLRDCGFMVVDADRIVSELYRPGEAGYRALVGRYGEAIVRADGEIDRSRLASVALATPEGAAELNRLIHPLVIAREEAIMREAESAGKEIVVVEAALLLEAGGRNRYDRIVVVDAGRETQIGRAVARGLPRPEVEQRIARQMPRDKRLEAADYVIPNEGSVEELRRSSEQACVSLRADLERKKRTGRV